jgi:hypothetical protein
MWHRELVWIASWTCDTDSPAMMTMQKIDIATIEAARRG